MPSLRRPTFFLLTVYVGVVTTTNAADYPAEISDPCLLYGYCVPAFLGASGSASIFSGAGSLTQLDASPAGSLADPWLLEGTLTGSPMYLYLAGGGSGPLVSPTDLNPTGSYHETGRYFLFSLTNTSATAWTSVRLDLELQPGTPSSTHDALTFGEGDNDPTLSGPDLLSTYGADKFTTVSRVPPIIITDDIPLPGGGSFQGDQLTDAIVFSGGTVMPSETVRLLFTINSGVGAGIVPNFYLKVAADPVPEPSTLGLAGLALGALAVIARRRRS